MKQSGFNPQARWDRHIPETSEEVSGDDQFPQAIEVLAFFGHGKVSPRQFRWNKKLYTVEKVTYAWQERRGQERINHFSISTGPDFYQISFNTTHCNWQIEKIII